nr:DUF3883 domain-containing protein [uncultured Trichococcus sp.]
MLTEIVKEINTRYIEEAKNSPTLLKDMAAMEMYMAESYNGRIFIEMLQNADDAGATKIVVRELDGYLIVANNGRPFERNDVISISRSGGSLKKRGTTIGYRGVGFKSTTFLSKEIIIYSNKTYFEFSNKKCAAALNLPESSVPTIRIPFLHHNPEKRVADITTTLSNEGFQTIFIFKDASLKTLEAEISKVDFGYFLFLNNVSQCSIELLNFSKLISLTKKRYKNGVLARFDNNSTEEWYVTDSLRQTSLAFKVENNVVVPCNKEEAVYHSYLPTLDYCPFLCKINADFTTDPSRKHITLDERTDSILDTVADGIFAQIKDTLFNAEGTMFGTMMDIINKPSAFTLLNSKLNNKLKEKILSEAWIFTKKRIITINEYKLLPYEFESAEDMLIRKNSTLISEQSALLANDKLLPSFNDFARKYATGEYGVLDLIKVLGEVKFVKNIPDSIYTKIFAYVLGKYRFLTTIENKGIDVLDIYVPLEKNYAKLRELQNNPDVKIQEEFQHSLSENASASDLKHFLESNNIKVDMFLIPKKANQGINLSFGRSIQEIKKEYTGMTGITKWRSAEIQCVEIEKAMGFSAVDVSRKNVGYDVESTDIDGNKRYIEVKLVKNNLDFSITNNEYTAANQYGDEYFICLIQHEDDKVVATYIQNPLKNAVFEKRIRQWEWVCEKFSGKEVKMPLSN